MKEALKTRAEETERTNGDRSNHGYPKSSLQLEQRNELVLRHLPLVKHVVNGMAANLSNSAVMDYDDAINCGVLGLMEAIERYDPSRQTSFASYAVFRIRGAIQDAMRRLDHLPRSLRRRRTSLWRTTEALSNELGRTPSDAELAERQGISLGSYHTMIRELSLTLVSLDELLGEGIEAGAEAGGEERPPEARLRMAEAYLEATELRESLGNAIASLPQRERRVIHLRYGKSFSMKAIGESLSVSESRACQLHTRAIQCLKRELEDLALAA